MHKPIEPSDTRLLDSVSGVKSDQIDLFWRDVRPLIRRVVDKYAPQFSLEHIYNNLKSGNYQLIIFGRKSIEMMWITTITNYGNETWCTILMAAGNDIDHWLHYLPHIEEWAKSQTCSKIEILGRKGWKRKLKHLDYVSRETVHLIKEL